MSRASQPNCATALRFGANLHPVMREALTPFIPNIAPQTIEQRLDDLMLRVREEKHELVYNDLVWLRGLDDLTRAVQRREGLR